MTVNLPEPPPSGIFPRRTFLLRTVAGYARFSPDDATKISIEMQEEAIKRVCKDRGWNYLRTYSDENVSGSIPPLQLAKEDSGDNLRFGLSDLLDSMGEPNFNFVMVYEVARLARDQGMFWTIIDLMNSKNVLLSTAAVPDITSDKPEFQMVAGVLQSVAAFQLGETKKKTRDALATLKMKGYAVSRPRLGFELIPENPADPEHSHRLLKLDSLGVKALGVLAKSPQMKATDFALLMGIPYKSAWHLMNNIKAHMEKATA